LPVLRSSAERQRSRAKQEILGLKIFWLLLFVFFTPIAMAVNLDTKIGQMIMIGFDGSALNKNDQVAQDIASERIGGVVLFDYNQRT
jgi:beta-N-acetylhexosaminidase